MRLSFLLLALAAAPSAAAQTLYVDANLTTGAGDGSSWADAFQGPGGLQDALAAASGGEIWVAQGTYLPSTTGSRAGTFRLESGLAIRGGFAGGETSAFERPARGAAPSVLSGDLSGNDTASATTRVDNSFHVVNAQGANATALLDRFTIVGGNANGGGSNNDRGGGILCAGNFAPRVVDCDFVDNRCTFGGGAGYINNGGDPEFIGCRFEDNVGGQFGGAFDIAFGGSILFDGCWFEGNRAVRAGALEIFGTNQAVVANSVFVDNTVTGSSGGGALWFGNGSSSRVVGCTIVENTANTNAAGGIRVQGANPRIQNCILWGNTGTGTNTAANQVTLTANVSHSLVEGGFAGGTGNIAADPQFMDQAQRDFSLPLTSPAVDAADGGALVAGLVSDFAGGRRAFDAPAADTGTGTPSFVDMGAFEATTDIGAYYCEAIVNASGLPGRIRATGSVAAADNDVTLVAEDLTPNQFGIFVVGAESGFAPATGGVGTLCLGGQLGRYSQLSQILDSGPNGTFTLDIDLTAIPQGGVNASTGAGDTWYFQAWYRDVVFITTTSNFTDAVAITFE
ncbi:MAG: right-handed parallel beta-helix repeat-containing protein [Planctomycetota bacterium]